MARPTPEPTATPEPTPSPEPTPTPTPGLTAEPGSAATTAAPTQQAAQNPAGPNETAALTDPRPTPTAQTTLFASVTPTPAPSPTPTIAATATPEPTIDPALIPALRSPGEILVWHTSNGKWYHATSSCSSMNGEKQHSPLGEISEGLAACPYCQPVSRSALNVENAVYVDGSQKWHTDFACQAIAGSWTISPLSAAQSDAALSPCEVCGAVYYAAGLPQAAGDATAQTTAGAISNADTIVFVSERNGYYHAANSCPNAAGITLNPMHLTDALRAGKQRCPACEPAEPMPAE